MRELGQVKNRPNNVLQGKFLNMTVVSLNGPQCVDNF